MASMFSSYEFRDLADLFVLQLEDLYDSEKRLAEALPKMAAAARTPELADAFNQHLRETEAHARMLEQIFERLGRKPERETSPAMKGLIQEGEYMVDARGDDAVRDAALIASAQKVEHYEIAGYGTARTYAQELGFADVAQSLQSILDDEQRTDQRLTEIATSRVNPTAIH